MHEQNGYKPPLTDNGKEEMRCPFVSERGPECPLCGASSDQVNLDPGGYGHCDSCGGKFPTDR